MKEENELPVLQVKLLFKSEPKLDITAIEVALKTRFNDLSIAKPDENTFVIASEDHPAMFGLPELGYVNMPEIKQIENQQLEVSLTQSWDWQQANDIVSQCSYELLITSHKYSINQILDNNTHEQVVFFHKLVTSVASVLNPDAIWFLNSELVLNPEYYLENSNYRDYLNILGFVNVRYYVIDGANEVFVDTLGLYALGLPDFEFRFSDEDYNPQQVVGRLYDFAYHFLDNGVVFEHEEAIAGLYEDHDWMCLFCNSRGIPKRNVIRFED